MSQYLNFYISKLTFCSIIINESRQVHHPILERLRILSISDERISEFFKVYLKKFSYQVKHDIKDTENIKKSMDILGTLIDSGQKCIYDQNESWKEIVLELKQKKINIYNSSNLPKKYQNSLTQYFLDEVQKKLCIKILDINSETISSIPDETLVLFFLLKNSDDKECIALVSIKNNINRFIKIPESINDFIAVEDLIKLNSGKIFGHAEITEVVESHILRYEKIKLKKSEKSSYIKDMEDAIHKRKNSEICRVIINKNASLMMKSFISEFLRVDCSKIYFSNGPLRIRDAMSIVNMNQNLLRKQKKVKMSFLDGTNDQVFEYLKNNNVLIHRPYDSFDNLLDLIEICVYEPKIDRLYITLYRSEKNSRLSNLLSIAAKIKSVSVFMEINTRFEEEKNLNFGKWLESEGCKVIYGIDKYKVHAKMFLATFKDSKDSIVHLSTGNYMENTAKYYTDLDFITTKQNICDDVYNIFQYLNHGDMIKTKELIVSPFQTKKHILSLIEKEKKLSLKGKKCFIQMKCNGLVDQDVIDALYDASCAGVKIDLIVREICCLKPGVKDLSVNITVKSVVGCFLEHSRIYIFSNGKSSELDSTVYIGSNDLMPRNFKKRVEVMTPIKEKCDKQKVLNIMNTYLQDCDGSWIIDNNGAYFQNQKKKNKSAQTFLMS